MTGSKRTHKAHILSIVNGTVQIGKTLYQPSTRTMFSTTMAGLKNKEQVFVSEDSMRGAIEALRKTKQI